MRTITQYTSSILLYEHEVDLQRCDRAASPRYVEIALLVIFAAGRRAEIRGFPMRKCCRISCRRQASSLTDAETQGQTALYRNACRVPSGGWYKAASFRLRPSLVRLVYGASGTVTAGDAAIGSVVHVFDGAVEKPPSCSRTAPGRRTCRWCLAGPGAQSGSMVTRWYSGMQMSERVDAAMVVV
jgi:hypothetical protein